MCRPAWGTGAAPISPTATSSLTIAKTCSLPYLSASCWAVAKNAYQSSGVHVPTGLGNRRRSDLADCHQFIDHRQDMFFAVLVGELLGGREKRVPVVGRPCADRLGEQTPLEFGEVQVV